MSEILEAAKIVGEPVKKLFVDRIVEYLKLITSYEDNMDELLKLLRILCSKKLDIDAKVMEGNEKLRVKTKETKNWLKNVQELIENEQMKGLLKDDRVAEIVVKMMEHDVLKDLLEKEREIFDIVVQVVKKKCNKEARDREPIDVEEDDDYKKIAKIAMEVVKDTAEEIKQFMKRDDAAVAAVKLLNDDDLDKLREYDTEMAKVLSKAEGVHRMGLEHHDHGEEELLLVKHDEDIQPIDKYIIQEKVGIWHKRMGSLMAFMDDEKFKNSLSDEAQIGLEAMNVLSKSVGSKTEENSKQHRYCGWCAVRFDSYCHRHDMSQCAEIMVKAIKSMIGECPQWFVTRRKRADELENISSGFMEGLQSREEIMLKLLTALKDDKINVVGVFGMGGSGKTTFAKEVARKRTIDLFNKRVVVEVSETPNIKGIQDQIAEGIGFSLDDVHTVSQRAHKLYNQLKSDKKQKTLIILDNMWKKLKLDEVGIPCESTGDFCCKLMITTRERRVCADMNVQDDNILKMGMLDHRESLDLFENQTGIKVDMGEYKPVIDRLLRKCGGLPLAIVATGSALRGRNLPLWYQFAEESEKPISSQVSHEYSDTYSILETSYKLMDIEEKWRFFFLACLSPFESTLLISDLMRYAIGLDLFQRVNSLSEAMEQARKWAKELVSSSLLLKGDFDGQVKIHDVVRASAISFAEKGKDCVILVESIPRWMSTETFEKFNAISLLSGNDYPRLSGVNASRLEILLLRGDLSSTIPSSDFFVGMKNLKVLSLSDMKFLPELPESIGKLEHLRTLHLHHCLLGDIKLIGKLVNLLALSLRGSTLKELAIEIGELSKLRLLDMGGCKGDISIPANILSRLSHLEGLYMFNSFDDWSSNDRGSDNKASVSELNNACHLNVLEMEVPGVKQLSTLNDSRLFQQLSKFRIHVGSFFDRKLDNERVQPYHRILELHDVDASESECLKALFKITDCLLVDGASDIENFVPYLDEEGFKDLKYVKASFNANVTCLISTEEQNEAMAFENLEALNLYNMYKLKRMCDGKAPAGLFSNLRRLTLEDLPALKYGLPLTVVPLNLVEVFIKNCRSLKFIVIENASVATADEPLIKNDRDIVRVPLLKSLILEDVRKLSSIVGRAEAIDDGPLDDQPFFNAKSIFPSLEILKLQRNQTIVTLWSTSCDVSSFHNLKVIEFSKCKKLKNLGYPSIFAALVHLEELSISNCKSLEEIITKETEGYEVRDRVIVFPALKHLFMSKLFNLQRFYRGNYKLDFPNLKRLNLLRTGSMTIFDGSENTTALFSDKIKFPRIEELDVQDIAREVTRLWDWSGVEGERESGSTSVTPVPNLKKLCIGNGLTSIPQSVSNNLSHLEVSSYFLRETLLSISENRGALWTYNQFPNLENLCARDCADMEKLFENEDDAAAISLCEGLTVITLLSMPKLKMIPFHLLKNIRSLNVNGLSWKYVFPADLFIRGCEQLQLLENLEIYNCEDMEAVIKDELVRDDQDFVFARLKTLTLFCLGITSFASKHNSPLHFPSLERVDVEFCGKIQLFCSGPFSAPKLKHISLWYNNTMEYFLSGNMNDIQELPSLESVNIKDCYSLLAFSSQPLVAPKLHQVSLIDSGKMKWFSQVGPNYPALEFPALEIVSVKDCLSMKSFSTGRLKTPKLSELIVDRNEYSKRANVELERMLGNLYECRTREHCEENMRDEGGDEDNMSKGGGDEEGMNNQGEEDINEEEKEKPWAVGKSGRRFTVDTW